MGSLFQFGQIVASPGFLFALAQTEDDASIFLRRHLTGDWGDLCHQNKKINASALKHGGRLLSMYHLKDGRDIYIITEADRSVTRLLLTEEY